MFQMASCCDYSVHKCRAKTWMYVSCGRPYWLHFLYLQDTFCTLKHLVELDLSGNQLRELPKKFGELAQLQRLDLYNNQLTSLPLDFWQLKKLKWLDLKNNPSLEPDLAKAAGTCVDEKECKECAQNVSWLAAECFHISWTFFVSYYQVLAYMKRKSVEAEREKQKRIENERGELFSGDGGRSHFVAVELRECVVATERRRQEEEEEQRKAAEAKKQKAELKQRRKEEHARQLAEKAAQEEKERAQEKETQGILLSKHICCSFHFCYVNLFHRIGNRCKIGRHFNSIFTPALLQLWWATVERFIREIYWKILHNVM